MNAPPVGPLCRLTRTNRFVTRSSSCPALSPSSPSTFACAVCTAAALANTRALPTGVPTGQLGARALALVGTLAGQFHLTQRKVQAVLSHIMGIRFGLGAVSQAHGLVAQGLAKPVAQLHPTACTCDAMPMRPGTKATGQTLWSWALVSDWGAKFTDPSRGQIAAKQVLGATPNFNLVSDRYARATTMCPLNSVRCVGLRRCVTSSASRVASGLVGRIGKRLLAYGYLLFRWRGQGKGSRTTVGCKDASACNWSQATQRTRCSRTANTCANLLKMWTALWTFVHNPLVHNEQCSGARRCAVG